MSALKLTRDEAIHEAGHAIIAEPLFDDLPCGCFVTIVGSYWWSAACPEHGGHDTITPMSEPQHEGGET